MTSIEVSINVNVSGYAGTGATGNGQHCSQLRWDVMLSAPDNPRHYWKGVSEAIREATERAQASVAQMAEGTTPQEQLTGHDPAR